MRKEGDCIQHKKSGRAAFEVRLRRLSYASAKQVKATADMRVAAKITTSQRSALNIDQLPRSEVQHPAAAGYVASRTRDVRGCTAPAIPARFGLACSSVSMSRAAHALIRLRQDTRPAMHGAVSESDPTNPQEEGPQSWQRA